MCPIHGLKTRRASSKTADTYIHFKSSIINKYKDLYVLMFTHMHIHAFIFLQVFGESSKWDHIVAWRVMAALLYFWRYLTNIDHAYKIRGPDRGSVPVQRYYSFLYFQDMPQRLWGCDLHIAGHTHTLNRSMITETHEDHGLVDNSYDLSPVWPLNCAIEGVTKNLISHADPSISWYIRLPLALVGYVRFLQMAIYDFPQQTHGRISHKYGQTNAQRQYQFI